MEDSLSKRLWACRKTDGAVNNKFSVYLVTGACSIVLSLLLCRVISFLQLLEFYRLRGSFSGYRSAELCALFQLSLLCNSNEKIKSQKLQ